MPQSFEQDTRIHAPADRVWSSLTQTGLMKEWMGEPEMHVEVTTDWTIGGPIIIHGFHHAPFRNAGVVLEFHPTTRLAYTQLSSLSRLPDEPGNHTTLQFSLAALGDTTSLHLSVSGFPTETIFRHLHFYWRGTLEILKRSLEQRHLAGQTAVAGQAVAGR